MSNRELPVLNVTTGVLFRNGRFFCGRRAANLSMAGKWEFPGGKIEPGETPEKCVVRELYEELGVKASVIKFLTVVEHDYENFRRRLYVFICHPDEGEPESHEHTEQQWLTYEELMKLPWDECDIQFVRLLKNWQD